MQLPVSALPEVDYPTIQVVTFYPGADPGRDGFVRDLSAGAAVRPGARTEPDDFDQFVWQFGDHAAVRSRSEHRRRRAASAGRDQLAARRILPTDLPNPPIYNKVNPADAPILTLALTSDSLPLVQSRRSRGHCAGAENFAVARRRTGFDQRRTEAGRAHSGQPDRAGLVWTESGGSAHRAGAGQRRSGQGRHRWPAAVLHDRRQRSAFFQRAV